MKPNRMNVLAASCLAIAANSTTALGQSYPVKPVRLVIGYPPGGGADISARLLAPRLSTYLGQQVLVENKPGAGTNIANEMVARSAPDGYTLLMNSPTVAINMSLYKQVNFDTLRDFAPVSVFAVTLNVMVTNASLPARNVAEFLALARSQPGKLNFSSAGSGTTQHLAGELLKTLGNVNMVHVPYKGGGPAMTALLAGEVQFSFANSLAISPHVKSGRLRALALTGVKRSDQMPDVPTMKEAGVNMVMDVWQGVLAPAGTPRAVVGRLSELIARAGQDAEVKKRLTELGSEPVGNSPEEFAAMLRNEVSTWAAVVKASGATAEE